jgi:hypothetical protein
MAKMELARIAVATDNVGLKDDLAKAIYTIDANMNTAAHGEFVAGQRQVARSSSSTRGAGVGSRGRGMGSGLLGGKGGGAELLRKIATNGKDVEFLGKTFATRMGRTSDTILGLAKHLLTEKVVKNIDNSDAALWERMKKPLAMKLAKVLTSGAVSITENQAAEYLIPEFNHPRFDEIARRTIGLLNDSYAAQKEAVLTGRLPEPISFEDLILQGKVSK